MGQLLPNRTLVIGLGESGTDVVRSLKKKVQSAKGNWPVLTYLCIRARDVDVSDPWLSPAEQVVLQEQHLWQFVRTVPELAQEVDPSMEARLEAGDPDVLCSRLAGHLMYCRAKQSVDLALAEMIRRLYDPDIRWSQAIDQKSIGLTTNVYIAMDLEDPIASGCLHDLLSTVLDHNRWREGEGRGVRCFVLMSAYGQSERGQAQSFAALREWETWLKKSRGISEAGAGDSEDFHNRVHYFLIELTNERDLPRSQALRTPAYRNEMIRDWLYHVIVEQPGRVSAIQRNLASSRARSHLPLSSLGLTVGIVPYTEINEVLMLDLGRVLLTSLADEPLNPQSDPKARQDAEVQFSSNLARDVVIRGDTSGETLTNDLGGLLPLPVSEQQEVLGEVALGDYPNTEWLDTIQRYISELESRLQRHRDRIHRRVEQELLPRAREQVRDHMRNLVRETLYQALGRAKVAVDTLFSRATDVRNSLDKVWTAARAVVNAGRFSEPPRIPEKEHHQSLMEVLEIALLAAFITILVLTWLFSATGHAISLWQFLRNQKWLCLMVSIWVGVRTLLELARLAVKYLKTIIVPRTEAKVQKERVQSAWLWFVAGLVALGSAILAALPSLGGNSIGSAGLNLLTVFVILVAIQHYLLGLWYVKAGKDRFVPTGLQMGVGVLSTAVLIWLGVWVSGCVSAWEFISLLAAWNNLTAMWSEQRQLFWLVFAMPGASLLKLLYDWFFLVRRRFDFSKKPEIAFSLAATSDLLDILVPLVIVLVVYAAYLGIGTLTAFGYWQQALWASLVLLAIGAAWKKQRFWRRLVEREFIWLAFPYMKAYPETKSVPALGIKEIRDAGTKALRNEPSWELSAWRGFVLCVLVALVTLLFRDRLSGPVPSSGFLDRLLSLLTTILGIRTQETNATQLTFMVLGSLGVLKYVWDFYHGRRLVTHEGRNAPSSANAIAWMIAAVVVSAVVGVTSVLGVVPGAWLAPPESQYFFGIGVILLGLLVAVRYFWEFSNDKARYEWYAREWLEWERNFAKASLNLCLVEEAVTFYDGVLDFLRKEKDRLNAVGGSISLRLQQLEQNGEEIAKSIRLTSEGYSRFLVDISGARERWGFSWEDLAPQDILAKYRDLASSRNDHALEDWVVGNARDLDERMFRDTLWECTKLHFKSKWEHLSAVHFLSHGDSPSTEQYERDAYWLFQGESLPYWSYRGGVAEGALLAAFQLPAIGQEFKPLRDALQGLEQHLGTAVQRDYADDSWTIVCLMVRSGLPASRLESYHVWERNYRNLISKAPYLHTRLEAIPNEVRARLARESAPIGPGHEAGVAWKPEVAAEPDLGDTRGHLLQPGIAADSGSPTQGKVETRSVSRKPRGVSGDEAVRAPKDTGAVRGRGRARATRVSGDKEEQPSLVASDGVVSVEQQPSAESVSDPWTILGIRSDAGLAEIEEAWQRRVAALASAGLSPEDHRAKLSELQRAREMALQARRQG